MTKPRPRCRDHEGNTIVLVDRPTWEIRPCGRPWDAKDRRKLAQGAYNARSKAKITLPREPWAQKEDV